jgi:hypothetical protein
MIYNNSLRICAALTALTMARAAQADDSDSLSCPVTYSKLKSALMLADKNEPSQGFGNHFWAVVVNRGGVVCAVAFFLPGGRLAMACQPADRSSQGIHGQRPEPQ